jgi:peptidoglycan/LPS O-acetylase OafA/YrhL
MTTLPASAADQYLRGHLPGLDGIRGLAILLVMTVHFIGGAVAETPLQKFFVKAAVHGWMGVDLFFVLSGFLITGILLGSKNKPRYFRNFYARRALRIFPLYYAVLIALFLILPLLVMPSPLLETARSHQIWLWTYTSNFFIAWTGTWDSLNYVAHFWSLAIEEHFYLVWPLVVFYFPAPTLKKICIGVIVFALALRIALALADINETSISVLTPCRIDALCVGAFIALRLREPGVWPRWMANSNYAVLASGAALFAVMAFASFTGLAEDVLHQVRGTFIALFFGALILLALKPASNAVSYILQGPYLGFFGKYSYGLYVYHGILTWYFMETHLNDQLTAWSGSLWLAMAARMLIGVGLSLLIAVPSYHLFEKRFLDLKRYF